MITRGSREGHFVDRLGLLDIHERHTSITIREVCLSWRHINMDSLVLAMVSVCSEVCFIRCVGTQDACVFLVSLVFGPQFLHCNRPTIFCDLVGDVWVVLTNPDMNSPLSFAYTNWPGDCVQWTTYTVFWCQIWSVEWDRWDGLFFDRKRWGRGVGWHYVWDTEIISWVQLW